MIAATALGALVGIVLALTGAGGGLIALPLLVFVLEIGVRDAAPIGLMAVGISSAVGAGLGWLKGRVRYRAALLIGGTGMLLAPFGVWMAGHLPEWPLCLGFAAVMFWTSLSVARKLSAAAVDAAQDTARSKPVCLRDPCTGRFIWTQPCARALSLTGAVSGTLTGLLGVGGGFVIVPALGRHSDLPPHSAVSTSLAVIALVSLSGVASAGMLGSVNWLVALPFALGAAGAQFLATPLAAKLGGQWIQRCFSVLCAAVAVALIIRGLRAAGWSLH